MLLSFNTSFIAEQLLWHQGIRVTGTMVNYLLVCQRKLWLHSKGLGREQDSELVTIGSIIHQDSFSRENKEVLVFDRIMIDHRSFVDGIVIHEVKKTRSKPEAARAQLLFYLYELHRHGVKCSGELHFLSSRRKEQIVFDNEMEEYVEGLLDKITKVLKMERCPEIPEGAPCRKCSYRDYCRM